MPNGKQCNKQKIMEEKQSEKSNNNNFKFCDDVWSCGGLEWM